VPPAPSMLSAITLNPYFKCHCQPHMLPVVRSPDGMQAGAAVEGRPRHGLVCSRNPDVRRAPRPFRLVILPKHSCLVAAKLNQNLTSPAICPTIAQIPPFDRSRTLSFDRPWRGKSIPGGRSPGHCPGEICRCGPVEALVLGFGVCAGRGAPVHDRAVSLLENSRRPDNPSEVQGMKWEVLNPARAGDLGPDPSAAQIAQL
jgi:hypothetical protein